MTLPRDEYGNMLIWHSQYWQSITKMRSLIWSRSNKSTSIQYRFSIKYWEINANDHFDHRSRSIHLCIYIPEISPNIMALSNSSLIYSQYPFIELYSNLCSCCSSKFYEQKSANKSQDFDRSVKRAGTFILRKSESEHIYGAICIAFIDL